VKLTIEEKIKLKPILRLQSALRIVNITMDLMGLVAFTVWYK
jgi:hypothetical protein